jgi:hypothetical protein
LVEKAADPTDRDPTITLLPREPTRQEQSNIAWRLRQCERWGRNVPRARRALCAILKASGGRLPTQEALGPLSLRDTKIAPKWAKTIDLLLDYLKAQSGSKLASDSQGGASLAKALLSFARSRLHAQSDWLDLSARLSHRGLEDTEKYLHERLRRLIAPCVTNGVGDRCLERNGRASIALLCEYPVLAKLLAIEIDNWVKEVSDLLARFAHDRQSISRRFRDGSDLGPILSIQWNLSDAHRGGRTVAGLIFQDDLSVFYKPRSGQGEVFWAELLDWLMGEGFPVIMRSMAVTDHQTYCWSAEVRAEPCLSARSVRNYFIRAGITLCLGHLLRAVDWHCDNLIAAGEFPIIVDAEALWHPDVSPLRRNKHRRISVYRTGLLPRFNAGVGDNRRPGLANVGYGPHRVRWEGRLIKPVNYANEIQQGFELTWSFLSGNKQRLQSFKDFQSRASRMARRRIYRATADYTRILQRSLHPALLREGVDRYLFLVLSCVQSGLPSAVSAEEVRQLNSLDIPALVKRESCPPPIITQTELAQCKDTISSAFLGEAECRRYP